MKSIFASKTFWVNLVVLVAGVTATVSGSDFIKDYPQAVAIFASVQGALNIVLRLVTNKAIR